METGCVDIGAPVVYGAPAVGLDDEWKGPSHD